MLLCEDVDLVLPVFELVLDVLVLLLDLCALLFELKLLILLTNLDMIPLLLDFILLHSIDCHLLFLRLIHVRLLIFLLCQELRPLIEGLVFLFLVDRIQIGFILLELLCFLDCLVLSDK